MAELRDFVNGDNIWKRATQALVPISILVGIIATFGLDNLLRATPIATAEEAKSISHDSVQVLRAERIRAIRALRTEIRERQQEETEIIWCLARTPPDQTPIEYCDLPARPSQED